MVRTTPTGDKREFDSWHPPTFFFSFLLTPKNINLLLVMMVTPFRATVALASVFVNKVGIVLLQDFLVSQFVVMALKWAMNNGTFIVKLFFLISHFFNFSEFFLPNFLVMTLIKSMVMVVTTCVWLRKAGTVSQVTLIAQGLSAVLVC